MSVGSVMPKPRRRVAVAVVLLSIGLLVALATRSVLRGRDVLRSLTAARVARNGDVSRVDAVLQRVRRLKGPPLMLPEEPAGDEMRTWFSTVLQATAAPVPCLPAASAAWLRAHDDELDDLAGSALAVDGVPVDP